MKYSLTEEEKFADRLELIGYATSGLSAIGLVVYFAMLFFSPAVQYQPVWEKLGLFSLMLATLCLGFFIPKHRSFARHLLYLIFMFILILAYYQGWQKANWFYIAAWWYSLAGAWILRHPVSIRNFRGLKPYEQKQLAAADWLTLHGVFLTYYSLIITIDGVVKLSEAANEYHYDPDAGMLMVFSGILALMVLQFFRRLFPWSRWVLILASLMVGLIALPATIDKRIQNYLEYWQALAKFLYFISLGLFLLFSPKIKQAFGSNKKLPAPASPNPKT